jgi:hypothetical protein
MVGQIGKKSCDLSHRGITKDIGRKSWSGVGFWGGATEDVIERLIPEENRRSEFRPAAWWATFALRGHSQPADKDFCVIARIMAVAWTAQGKSIKTFN